LSSHTNDFHHHRRRDRVKNMIQTHNLQLLPVERIHVEALLRSKSEPAALLQVSVPDGWPHFPDSLSALLRWMIPKKARYGGGRSVGCQEITP
jgi:hypothetical protein